MQPSPTVWNAIGNTPLIKVKSLSEITGCEIFGKAEFMNPGGSIKDRTAMGLIQTAEKDYLLGEGGVIVEATGGNTGVGLVMLAKERGYHTVLTLPDNLSEEKYNTLKVLGAELVICPSCEFTDERHFYHRAQKLAAENEQYVCTDQFENLANAEVHFRTTGPEIWDQLAGNIDVLTLASGTGGTIGGLSRFFKEKSEKVRVVAADPQGSAIYSYIKHGELAGTGSTFAEGIGITRITANFASALIDDAVVITDQEMINMLYHVASADGLLIGMSSALNLFSAYKIGLANKNSGQRIVTVLCDDANKYASRVFNADWLTVNNLMPHSIQ